MRKQAEVNVRFAGHLQGEQRKIELTDALPVSRLQKAGRALPLFRAFSFVAVPLCFRRKGVCINRKTLRRFTSAGDALCRLTHPRPTRQHFRLPSASPIVLSLWEGKCRLVPSSLERFPGGKTPESDRLATNLKTAGVSVVPPPFVFASPLYQSSISSLSP